jgi:DNA-binding beta-propeller fold protein YncE
VWGDSLGNIYLSDTGGNRIRKVTKSSGIISLIAGNPGVTVGFGGDGGQATSAELNSPNQLFVDTATNRLYFADETNNCVRVVNLNSGIITRYGGVCGPDSGDSVSGVMATSAKMNLPSGLAIFSNMYVSMGDACTIKQITPGGQIYNFAGTYQSASFGGDGLAASTFTGLSSPQQLYMDTVRGRLYIADMINNVIRMVAISNGAIITTVAGSGEVNSMFTTGLFYFQTCVFFT